MGTPWGPGHTPDPNAAPRLALLQELTDRQATLFQALEKRNPMLACIYLGALKVLGDEANPDAIPLAAHGLRELMEKLPQSLDVPIRAPVGELPQRVADLRSEWEEAVETSACHNGVQWQGQIDPPLRKLLKALDKFFAWFSNSPTRRDEATWALRRLSGRLPDQLERSNVKTWMDLFRFFTKVAHHGPDWSREEFSRRLNELEHFLLDRLQPRTFEDFDEIDALLEEAARSG